MQSGTKCKATEYEPKMNQRKNRFDKPGTFTVLSRNNTVKRWSTAMLLRHLHKVQFGTRYSTKVLKLSTKFLRHKKSTGSRTRVTLPAKHLGWSKNNVFHFFSRIYGFGSKRAGYSLSVSLFLVGEQRGKMASKSKVIHDAEKKKENKKKQSFYTVMINRCRI